MPSLVAFARRRRFRSGSSNGRKRGPQERPCLVQRMQLSSQAPRSSGVERLEHGPCWRRSPRDAQSSYSMPPSPFGLGKLTGCAESSLGLMARGQQESKSALLGRRMIVSRQILMRSWTWRHTSIDPCSSRNPQTLVPAATGRRFGDTRRHSCNLA